MSEIWEMKVENLTRLGGPMGSEYVTTIKSELWGSFEAALSAAKRDHEQRGYGTRFPSVYIDEPHKKTYDAGGHGYVLRRRIVMGADEQ